MAYCPHCNRRYDEDNETQPCCACGHPISCGCGGGHSHSRPTSPPSSLPDLGTGNTDEDPGDTSEADESDEESSPPTDGLPF